MSKSLRLKKMDLERIIRTAYHQKTNYKRRDGRIEDVDLAEHKITIAEKGTEKSSTPRLHTFKMNDTAEEQLLESLDLKGVVKDFAKGRKKWDDSEVVQFAIDTRINQIKENNRVRPKQIIYDDSIDTAIAVKSDKYTGLETQQYDILEAIDDKYTQYYNGGEMSYIDSNRMYVSFTNIDMADLTGNGMFMRDMTGRAKGDIIGFGFQITNSMTGFSSLVVGEICYRIACDNGMVTAEAIDVLRKAHIYQNMVEGLNNDINLIRNKAGITLKAIARSVDTPYVIENVDSMPKYLTGAKIPTRHHKGIQEAYLEEPLGQDEEGRINRWGIYNGITRYNTHKFPKTNFYDPYESQVLMSRGYAMLVM